MASTNIINNRVVGGGTRSVFIKGFLCICLFVVFLFPFELDQIPDDVGAVPFRREEKEEDKRSIAGDRKIESSIAVSSDSTRVKETPDPIPVKETIQHPNLRRPEPSRAEAVKNAMRFVWSKYTERAWGYDELTPLTGRGKNNWGTFGFSLIDSLDTLYIMGLMDEFNHAKEWVRDSFKIPQSATVNVFETNIRVLGGLLGAFAVSKDPIFRDKANLVATMLLPAVHRDGFAHNRISTATKRTYLSSSLAEAGTLQLEFMYTSEITNNSVFQERADQFYSMIKQTANFDGLFTNQMDKFKSTTYSENDVTGTLTFGANGDSFYEYLLKVWLYGGKKDAKLRELYDASIEGMIKHLICTSPDGFKYIGIAHATRGKRISRFEERMEHLACFVPGLLALGSKHDSENPERSQRHLELAEELMETCYSMFSLQKSKLAPECSDFRVSMRPSNGLSYYILRPEISESLFVLYQLTSKDKYKQWGWELFDAIEKRCKVQYGYAGVKDVREMNVEHKDSMESFFLGETLKYLYMLQAPESAIDLNKYVFNTEAHPVPINGGGFTST